MSDALLLCTDLDRTLIPNGPQPESLNARRFFNQLCASREVTLAYASGRHRSLVQSAITTYTLPEPDYVIGDVGTTIYRIDGKGEWRHLADWESRIGRDWAGHTHADLSRLFADLNALRLQEMTKQSRFKLSFYVSLHANRPSLEQVMKRRLEETGINATLVWSTDEPAGIGLLDVLPAGATKLHAVEFLMEKLACNRNNTVFAGDSGNDMPVLVSRIPSVLVNNASSEVKREAMQKAKVYQSLDSLYLAKGGFMQMNGNYSAGILEGIAHYHPRLMEGLLPNTSPRN